MNLPEDKKEQLRDIDKKLSKLKLKFGETVAWMSTSLDPYQTPRYSASDPGPSCLNDIRGNILTKSQENRTRIKDQPQAAISADFCFGGRVPVLVDYT